MRTDHFSIGIFSNILAMLLEFRQPITKREVVPDLDGELSCDDPFAMIRCPICRWKPEESSRWTCWDCEFPKFFSEGCGKEWSTFETGGRCPGCSHQWMWTSCLSCWAWSTSGLVRGLGYRQSGGGGVR